MRASHCRALSIKISSQSKKELHKNHQELRTVTNLLPETRRPGFLSIKWGSLDAGNLEHHHLYSNSLPEINSKTKSNGRRHKCVLAVQTIERIQLCL